MTWSRGRWQPGAAIVAAALVAVGGPATGSVVRSTYSATIHFGGGRQSRSFRLHEPAGVILLYRIDAPAGAKVRGFAQLPRITVPLRIGTGPTGPGTPCTDHRSRVRCTVGEEWCPMPEGTWEFRVDKLAGPAGDVTLWFRGRNPPGRAA